MPTKETQKLVLAVSACFAGALVAVAFLFSNLLEWRAHNAQYGREVPTATYPCEPGSAIAAKTENAPVVHPVVHEDELTPLDPSDEEPLNAEGALVSAEVLDLSETVQALPQKPETVKLQWDKVEGAKAYYVQAWQLKGDKKVVVFDDTVQDTETRIERKNPGDIHWQVAAIDSAGKAGEVAGPTIIRHRKPASHQD